MNEYIELDLPIEEIRNLLPYFEVDVDSPDGWVPVNQYRNDLPDQEEYVLEIENENDEPPTKIHCSGEHQFEVLQKKGISKNITWQKASECETGIFLTKDGYKYGTVRKTGNIIPVVDIEVVHPNNRYYTNGVSSHNTGVGKTMAMCHMAAANLMHGKSVLYITMEMSQIRIAERIDANLLDVTLDDLKMIGFERYKQRSEKLLQKTNGKLIIKEFPTASAHSGHFRHLLNELRLKKNFVPDIVYIDYLNICASYRMKMGNSVNSYSYIKAIAEELRGLAVEFDIAIVSATQTNREGFNNSDIDLTNTSESIGLPATADFMVALIKTDELEAMGQIMVKQLKNRYGDLNKPARFVVGVDREKMRLFDLDESAQANVSGGYVPGPANYSKPVMDKAGDYSEFETVDTNSFKPKTNSKRVSF